MELSRGATIFMFPIGMFSTLTCIPMLMSYYLFPEIRRKSYMRIVFYIAISNFFNSIGTAMGYPVSGSAACWYMYSATTIGCLAAVNWSAIITYMIHGIVFDGKVPTIDWRHHLFCWGVPIIATFLPLVNVTAGNQDGMGWCWIVPTSKTTYWEYHFWMWFSFYFWLWAGVTVMGYYFFKVYFHVKEVLSTTQAALEKIVNNIKYYPLIIAVTWIFELVYDVLTTYIDLNGPVVDQLLNLGAALACTQGMLTSFLFFYTNADVRRSWCKFLTTGRFEKMATLARRVSEVKLLPASLRRESSVSSKKSTFQSVRSSSSSSAKVYPAVDLTPNNGDCGSVPEGDVEMGVRMGMGMESPGSARIIVNPAESDGVSETVKMDVCSMEVLPETAFQDLMEETKDCDPAPLAAAIQGAFDAPNSRSRSSPRAQLYSLDEYPLADCDQPQSQTQQQQLIPAAAFIPIRD